MQFQYCKLYIFLLDSTRTQIASIITGGNTSQSQNATNIQRPTQIALSATPLVAQSAVGTSYHVPRGPAVVANLAAPRSNVTTVRAPMVVTAQTNQVDIYLIWHTFVIIF